MDQWNRFVNIKEEEDIVAEEDEVQVLGKRCYDMKVDCVGLRNYYKSSLSIYLLIGLKKHLEYTYKISHDKILNYNPNESNKSYERPIPSRKLLVLPSYD